MSQEGSEKPKESYEPILGELRYTEQRYSENLTGDSSIISKDRKRVERALKRLLSSRQNPDLSDEKRQILQTLQSLLKAIEKTSETSQKMHEGLEDASQLQVAFDEHLQSLIAAMILHHQFEQQIQKVNKSTPDWIEMAEKIGLAEKGGYLQNILAFPINRLGSYKLLFNRLLESDAPFGWKSTAGYMLAETNEKMQVASDQLPKEEVKQNNQEAKKGTEQAAMPNRHVETDITLSEKDAVSLSLSEESLSTEESDESKDVPITTELIKEKGLTETHLILGALHSEQFSLKLNTKENLLFFNKIMNNLSENENDLPYVRKSLLDNWKKNINGLSGAAESVKNKRRFFGFGPLTLEARRARNLLKEVSKAKNLIQIMETKSNEIDAQVAKHNASATTSPTETTLRLSSEQEEALVAILKGELDAMRQKERLDQRPVPPVPPSPRGSLTAQTIASPDVSLSIGSFTIKIHSEEITQLDKKFFSDLRMALDNAKPPELTVAMIEKIKKALSDRFEDAEQQANEKTVFGQPTGSAKDAQMFMKASRDFYPFLNDLKANVAFVENQAVAKANREWAAKTLGKQYASAPPLPSHRTPPVTPLQQETRSGPPPTLSESLRERTGVNLNAPAQSPQSTGPKMTPPPTLTDAREARESAEPKEPKKPSP